MDGVNFLVHALGVNLGEDFLGLFEAALGNKVAGGFREAHGGEAVQGCRDDFDPEHDLPGLESGNACIVGRTRDAHDEVVRKERHEDTDHDGELLHGTEAAAQVGRCGFCDVDRGDDAGDTDAHATDDAPHDKVRDAEWYTGTDCTYEEQRRCGEHAADTAELVCQASGKVGTDRGAD